MLFYDENVDISNPFEYYFKPVSTISLTDAYSSYNVHVSNGRGFSAYNLSYDQDFLFDAKQILNEYIVLKPEIEQYISAEICNLLNNKSTLGIHVRYTDFGKYKNHPNKILLDDYLPEIEIAMESGNFEQIFLATDSLSAVEYFSNRYGGIIKYYNSNSLSLPGVDIGPHMNPDVRLRSSPMQLGMDVLKDMLTLVSCEGLISGMSNVSMFADLWKNAKGLKYKYRKHMNQTIVR